MIFLDDRVTRHPKVLDAGVAARTLWLNAICWAAQYRTGGNVTTEQLTACIAHELPELRMPGPDGRLRRATVAGLIERLVRAGLLEVVTEGVFRIHDFDAYQRTQPAAETAQVLEERKKVRNEKLSAAGMKGALARWGKRVREAMAPDGQAMPEAIEGHPEAMMAPAWPSGSPSSSEIERNQEEDQQTPSPSLMASVDGQAIDGHGHEAMPTGTREGGVFKESREKSPEAVSEVRLKAMPPPPTDLELFVKSVRQYAHNPRWDFNRRLPSNKEAFDAAMGWFDEAGLEGDDRAAAIDGCVAFFFSYVEEREGRTYDPVHFKAFLETSADHRPRKRRPTKPDAGPKKPAPPPEPLSKEDQVELARASGADDWVLDLVRPPDAQERDMRRRGVQLR